MSSGQIVHSPVRLSSRYSAERFILGAVGPVFAELVDKPHSLQQIPGMAMGAIRKYRKGLYGQSAHTKLRNEAESDRCRAFGRCAR